MKIKQFTDLQAWQHALELTVCIYKITSLFPKSEQFGIVQQIRRAVVSVGSNIAEGFGRQSLKEKIHFYYIANGSISELKHQLHVAKRIGYLDQATFTKTYSDAENCHRLLGGLIRKAKSFLPL